MEKLILSASFFFPEYGMINDVYLERDEEETNETNLSHFRKSLLFMAIIDC